MKEKIFDSNTNTWIYYLDGELHREDGPAIIYGYPSTGINNIAIGYDALNKIGSNSFNTGGTVSFFGLNTGHSINIKGNTYIGPKREGWFLHGISYTKEEHKTKLRELKLLKIFNF